ncbi:response regulator [Mesoterricola sediminis]|uniref:Response regulator n=1 Tax=Mesoterricola sediminis TaxID=2927980 RepID=A0AA48HHS2_9BACT|nr:response regulator [Mesoterricola sediminis]BDU78453.1 response regulator [Mesoterricola sediminis]
MQPPLPFETVTVLIAEDDEGHAVLIREHLEEAGLANPILRFRDGQEALDWFQGPGRGERCILLLDINMPRVDGIEVLRRLKADPATRTTPVIMLTTTDDPAEVALCYGAGCNLYLTKPRSFEAFSEALLRLGRFLPVIQVAEP